MKLASGLNSSFRILFLLGSLLTFSEASSQEDFDLDGIHTIAKDSTEEYRNFTLRTNSSVLNIEGTLVVRGDLTMEGNWSEFNMGTDARVIIFGDFITKNQVSIEVSGYLIVHGGFIKGGSENTGDLDVDNGNIYIHGQVDNWGDQFSTCSEYRGGTGAIETETCDYGTEEEYINNHDQFPDDLVDLVNCYDLSDIADQEVCEGQSATFSVASFSDVTYEWQEKIGDADWNKVGSASNTLNLPTVSIADDGKLYRVIVRSTDMNTSGCKISISRKVSLQVNPEGVWIGAADSNWNNPSNWSCNSLPTLTTNVTVAGNLANYPIISSGSNAFAKDLNIEAGASVIVDNNWIRISGNLVNQGLMDAGTGGVSFEGTTAQIISAGAFEEEIQNLNISNPGGVTNQTSISILNSLKVEEGVFQTGNLLLLVSNEFGTAYIDGSGAGEISGTVDIQRYLSNAYGYKYFSTPFSNSLVGDIIPFFDLIDPISGFPHLYEYLEDRKDAVGNDLTGWQKYLDPAAPIEPGKGYAVNTSGKVKALTLEISGNVNNGPVEVNLQNNNGTYSNGFNLVGNPYPSPVDWNSVALTGIDNAIYFFTAGVDNRYTGTYTSYVNGVSTDGRSSSIIPLMQGFFVRVSDPEDGRYPSTGSLKFTNSSRAGNQEKQDSYRANDDIKTPQIKLTVAFKGEKDSDATVIYFNNGSTQEFEKDLDAQKILNTAVDVPSFYNLTNKNERLAINAISSLSSGSMEIPLGISAERSGEMILTLFENLNFLPSLHIYLRDNKKKVLVDLNENPVYSFSAPKGENNSRFMLLLSTEKLSPGEMALATQDFSVYSTHEEILVKLNLLNNAKGKVILSNMSGQVLQSKTGYGKEELRFSGIKAPGVYLVSLEVENERATKKILHKK